MPTNLQLSLMNQNKGLSFNYTWKYRIKKYTREGHTFLSNDVIEKSHRHFCHYVIDNLSLYKDEACSIFASFLD